VFVFWKIGPLLPNSTIGNAISVLEMVLAPFLFLAINVDVSFNLWAPGALMFVVPEALSYRDESSVSLITSSSVLKYRILPPGGHGSKVKDELYCQSVGIGVVFSNTATFSFSSDVEFRTVGILKNPLSSTTSDGTGTIDLVANSLSVIGVGTKFTTELNIGDNIIYLDEEKEVSSIANNTSLILKNPFSYTVVAETFDIRKRFFNAFFNQTVAITASNTTPALLQPGEFILGSDGAGGGSQVQAKVAFANTSKVVLTGLDRSQARGNNSVITFVNDIVMDGVGYNVNGADSPEIVADSIN